MSVTSYRRKIKIILSKRLVCILKTLAIKDLSLIAVYFIPINNRCLRKVWDDLKKPKFSDILVIVKSNKAYVLDHNKKALAVFYFICMIHADRWWLARVLFGQDAIIKTISAMGLWQYLTPIFHRDAILHINYLRLSVFVVFGELFDDMVIFLGEDWAGGIE